MTALRRFAWGAALAAFSVTLLAQQAPTGYHQIYCAKVKPGKDADFNTVITGDLKKLAQYDLNAGRLSGWVVLHTMVPEGREARCDYAVVYFYPGLAPAPMSDADWAAELQKTIGKSPQQFTGELDDTGTLVESNITRYVALVGAAKEGDYLVFNSMTTPNIADWVAWEKKEWQPLMEAAVKQGTMSAWAVNVQIFPRGAKAPDEVSTVDIYPTWDAAIQGLAGTPKAMELWKSVHPDENPEDLMAQAEKMQTIEYSALYKVEQSLFPK